MSLCDNSNITKTLEILNRLPFYPITISETVKLYRYLSTVETIGSDSLSMSLHFEKMPYGDIVTLEPDSDLFEEITTIWNNFDEIKIEHLINVFGIYRTSQLIFLEEVLRRMEENISYDVVQDLNKYFIGYPESKMPSSEVLVIYYNKIIETTLECKLPKDGFILKWTQNYPYLQIGRITSLLHFYEKGFKIGIPDSMYNFNGILNKITLDKIEDGINIFKYFVDGGKKWKSKSENVSSKELVFYEECGNIGRKLFNIIKID